jgi:hypothetical protein
VGDLVVDAEGEPVGFGERLAGPGCCVVRAALGRRAPPATLSIAESLDRWRAYGYVYEGNVVMVARAYEDGSPADTRLISVVESAEYAPIIDAARSYWSKANNLAE